MITEDTKNIKSTPPELMYGIHPKEKGKPFKLEFIEEKLSKEFEILDVKTNLETDYIKSFFLKPKRKIYGPFNENPLRVYWMGVFTDQPKDPDYDFRVFTVYFEPDQDDSERNSFRYIYIARVAQLLGFLIDAAKTNNHNIFLNNMAPEKFLSLSQGGKLTLKENFLNSIWWYFEGYFLSPFLGGKTSFISDFKIATIFIMLVILALKFNIIILSIFLFFFSLILLYFSRRGTLTVIGYYLIGLFYSDLFIKRYSPSFEKSANNFKLGTGFLLIYAVIHVGFYGLRWFTLKNSKSSEREDVSGTVRKNLSKFRVFTLKGIINWWVMGFLLQYAPAIIRMFK